MPLKEGNTNQIISENIKELVSSGKTKEQATAIALDKAKDPKEKFINRKIEYKILKDVPVFKAGTYYGTQNGKRVKTTTTIDDLKDAVAAHKASTFIPPSKITHKMIDKHSGDVTLNAFPYRVGDITNLKVKNDTLFADYKVMDFVAELIENGFLTSHSAEFKENYKIGDKVYKRYLVGDALLGADYPALAQSFPFKMEDFLVKYSDADITEFELENTEDIEVIVYNDIGFNQGETDMKISKEEYGKKMAKYSDLSPMTYEAFSGLGEDKQKQYMEDMEKRYMSKEKKAYSDANESVSVTDVQKLIAQARDEARAEAEKRFADEKEAEVKAYSDQLESLKKQNEMILQKQRQTELLSLSKDNETFAYSLTSEGGFPVALENKIIQGLNNIDVALQDVNSTVTYSDNGENVEGSVKENIKSMLKAISKEVKENQGQVMFADKEILPVRPEGKQSGFQLDQQTREFVGDRDINEESLSEHEQVVKYMDEKNITDYEQAYDAVFGTSKNGQLTAWAKGL